MLKALSLAHAARRLMGRYHAAEGAAAAALGLREAVAAQLAIRHAGQLAHFRQQEGHLPRQEALDLAKEHCRCAHQRLTAYHRALLQLGKVGCCGSKRHGWRERREQLLRVAVWLALPRGPQPTKASLPWLQAAECNSSLRFLAEAAAEAADEAPALIDEIERYLVEAEVRSGQPAWEGWVALPPPRPLSQLLAKHTAVTFLPALSV